MRDGQRSRRLLLDAATAEFAEHGLAGARVDRIAAASGVNKAQMYAWHGSKDGLFEAVFADQLVAIVDAVPFTADDLPGYAVALYDSYLEAPGLVRLAAWRRLERVPVGDLLAASPHLGRHHAAIEAAQRAGTVRPGPRPDDVYSLVIALAGTWSPLSPTWTASPADPAADHRRRRRALREAVARALLPDA